MAKTTQEFAQSLATNDTVENPFLATASETTAPQQALSTAYQTREVAEVQSAMIIAKRFPRNQVEAMDRILQACARPGLAATAVYDYSRGGASITGPTIRLAEAIAQHWGNIQFGMRELSRSRHETTMEAFAWDVETNTRQTRVFQVPHERHTRAGVTTLTDPRDIYEAAANLGARRLRTCLLGIIPGDVVETAVAQTERTLRTSVELTPGRIQSMLETFEKFGVTKEMIEARIQRRIDALTPALFIQLGKIANSLADGMSQPRDWFDVSSKDGQAAAGRLMGVAQKEQDQPYTPSIEPSNHLNTQSATEGQKSAQDGLAAAERLLEEERLEAAVHSEQDASLAKAVDTLTQHPRLSDAPLMIDPQDSILPDVDGEGYLTEPGGLIPPDQHPLVDPMPPKRGRPKK